jgi:uncharacterized protein (TIGR02001 family)
MTRPTAKFKGAVFGSSLWRLAPLAPALLLLVPAPAAAQLAGSVGLDSDYRLRGYSLTGNDPALSAQISYDESSGLYFSLSALTELGHGTRFLGVIGNAGYAKRLSEHVTVDGGVIRSQIRSASQYNAGYKYTEVYAGAFVGPISGRIYYSPDYRNGDQSTLYGELESEFEAGTSLLERHQITCRPGRWGPHEGMSNDVQVFTLRRRCNPHLLRHGGRRRCAE